MTFDFAVLIEKSDHTLEYHGVYTLPAEEGDSIAVLKDALENVEGLNRMPKGFKLSPRSFWLLADPVPIPRTAMAATASLPSNREELEERAISRDRLTRGQEGQISWIIVAPYIPFISFALLIEKSDDDHKLEYHSLYTLTAEEDDSTAVLKDALENVEVLNRVPKGFKLSPQSFWLLADPVPIPQTETAATASLPSNQEELEDRALVCNMLTRGQEGQVSWIVVASFEPVTPPPSVARLHAVDENSVLPTREEVCAAGRKRDSPSAGAKNEALLETQKSTNLGAILNHCPLELSPPHITIYHPVFAKFIQLMNSDFSDFSSEELEQAYEFVRISTNIYEKESDRQSELRKLDIIDKQFWASQTIALEGSRSVISDGNTFVLCSKLPTNPKAFINLNELKNKMGEGGCDAADQADAYYTAVCSSTKYSFISASSCCPAFLVADEGSHVSVAGAVFADRFYSQKLTDYVYMGPRLGRQDGERSILDIAIRQVAKLFHHLRTCIRELHEYYSNLQVPDDIQALPSTPGTLRPSFLPRVFPFWQNFDWAGRRCKLSYTSRLASQYSAKMVFRADMFVSDSSTKRPVVVKFAPSYSKEAHTLLANHKPPLAPKLYHCDKVRDVGDLYVVVMDYVAEDDSIDNTLLSSAAAHQVTQAMRHLHANGYVFGDLRNPNIIQTKDGMMLIDFDWSGKAGEARYPADILIDAGIIRINWHKGVKRGGFIEREHDEHMLELLIADAY